MPFNPPESNTYINIKLTDVGRRMLSLGTLDFAKAVISDREIDYRIDSSGIYDIQNNRVLAPVDDYPSIDPINFDGTNPIALTNQQVLSVKQFNTAQTATYGLFSGFTNQWFIRWQQSDFGFGYKGVVYGSQTFGDTSLVFSGGGSVAVGHPAVDDYVYITWVAPQYGAVPYPASLPNALLVSGAPFNGLWYKIVSAATAANTFLLDRPIPDLGGTHTVGAYIYPPNAIEEYFGSASTQSTKFWNMNITRTNEVIGTDTTLPGVSGYSTYGSVEYAGSKHYLGFDDNYPAIGIIHYTNKFSGQTYGEQLIEKSVQINMPSIMWNNYPANNGQGVAFGLTLYDSYGNTLYDAAAKTTYRELRDGIESTSKIVGRVYHKLQIFVITDQDLLIAMSYKGNRNWTLPEPIVNLVSTPKSPLSTNDVTGLCESGKTYFVTYVLEADPYVGGSDSYGYTNTAPCGHIKMIDGEVDINGNPQYLSIQFPTNSFPYMRNDADSANGTGWNANRVRILINEQDKSNGYLPGSVPSNQWVALSGQGIYDCTTATSTSVIDPVALNSYQFVVSREDYLSGTTTGYYTLPSGSTSNGNYLSWGGEVFFFGTVDTQVFNTLYRTLITVVAANYEYNTTTNSTFDSLFDDYTYITEIAILDSQNQTVAVGKPTYPLRKSNSRYLAFQLQIDF